MCSILKFLGNICQPASQGTPSESSNEELLQPGSMDLNEEYAKAFRTESYHLFWRKVQSLTGNLDEGNGQSTPTTRLPSYRLLAEHLLEPDQKTVKTILHLKEEITDFNYNLVSDYFDNSAEASKLCGILLKAIEKARLNYISIKKVLEITLEVEHLTENQCNLVIQEFLLFMDGENPFTALASQNFLTIHEQYGDLSRQLEIDRQKVRKKVRKKLKFITGFKKASVFWLIVACAAVAVCGAVIAASHPLIAIVVAGPVFVVFSPLNLLKDLDTMSRLVMRLYDEVEHNKIMVRFCLQRKDDRHPVQEVVKQLRKNDDSFRQQLDELEENVYLCCMTINRARSLVVKEIQVNQSNRFERHC
eukprot:Gb_21456 [translate_table: standard]